jgi:N-acetylneuraminic acid mutarotase
MPVPLSAPAIGVVGARFYTAGGFDCTSGFRNDTFSYDPRTDTWQSRPAMPTARDSAVGVVADGILYVIGGNFEGSVATVQAYDPNTDTWTTKTPMPTPRDYVVAGAVGGLIYVAGGSESLLGTINTLEAYDPKTDTWATKAPMPTARYGASAGVINGILYVAGGAFQGPGTRTLSVVEAYDPEMNTWTSRAPMPTDRKWAAGGVIDGRLYVAGGWRSSWPEGPTSVVEAYDPLTDSWKQESPMPTARFLSAAAVAADVLYVVGGLLDPNRSPHPCLAINEAFTPFLMVSIDIKPGDRANTINLKSNGVVPVAILGSATFDPMTVDPTTVTLAGAHVATRGRGAPMTGQSDVNGDGYPDLLLYFRTQDLTALQQMDSRLRGNDGTAVGTLPLQVEAVLYGTTYSGQRIRGSDTVRIVPPSNASPHALPASPRGAPTNDPPPKLIPRGRAVRD